ncbi:MAG: helix-turn-helix domain-containing protein [Candidatus Acidiferrales bacterium]
MAGHTPWRQIRGRLTPEREARVAALKKQYEEEMVLEKVREARALTQEEVAARLHTSQANISKLEKRTDMLLTTLAKYLRAMGVELELRAVVPGVGSVRLKGLGESS